MSSIDQILQDASHLPEDQRLTLANLLLKLGEPQEPDEIRRAWETAIRDRIDRYDKGETESRPASEVFADIDRRLNR